MTRTVDPARVEVKQGDRVVCVYQQIAVTERHDDALAEPFIEYRYTLTDTGDAQFYCHARSTPARVWRPVQAVIEVYSDFVVVTTYGQRVMPDGTLRDLLEPMHDYSVWQSQYWAPWAIAIVERLGEQATQARQPAVLTSTVLPEVSDTELPAEGEATPKVAG